MRIKYLFLNIRCYLLHIHHWADNGWLYWKPDNGIMECDWCGKIKGE